jgi:SRSO17 transposase
MAGRRAEAAERFEEYLGLLGEGVGHADRAGPLRAYLSGLLLSGERKRVEPMAAKVDPHQVNRRHQSLHHFVANAPWDERAVIAVAREYALA